MNKKSSIQLVIAVVEAARRAFMKYAELDELCAYQ